MRTCWQVFTVGRTRWERLPIVKFSPRHLSWMCVCHTVFENKWRARLFVRCERCDARFRSGHSHKRQQSPRMNTKDNIKIALPLWLQRMGFTGCFIYLLLTYTICLDSCKMGRLQLTLGGHPNVTDIQHRFTEHFVFWVARNGSQGVNFCS